MQTYSEIEDGNEVIAHFFERIDSNRDGRLSWHEVKSALAACDDRFKMKLTDLLKKFEEDLHSITGAADGFHKSIDLTRFKDIVMKMPRIHGQRFLWVKSLNLNMLLARKLKIGDLFDELSGIKEMEEEELNTALKECFQDVESVVKSEWRLLKRSEIVLEEVEAAISKYNGEVGSFGDTEMFQEGLDNQIGSPDPFILTGIFRENILSAQSRERSVTSNYEIVFSSMQEYARVFGNPLEYESDPSSKLKDVNTEIPKFLVEVAKGKHPNVNGPTEAELKCLESEFRVLREYYLKISKINQNVFPGDIGNVQQSMEVQFEASDTESASKFHAEFVKLVDQAEDILFFVDSGQAPGKNTFNVTFFGTIKFFDSEYRPFMETLRSSHPSVKIQEYSEWFRTYIYCELERSKPINLPELLQRLDISELRQISALKESASKECHIDSIVTVAQTGSRIVCKQGRRHLSLRQLMNLPEIKEAKLRVEEAMQVYQYTGPLFQVNVMFTTLVAAALSCWLLFRTFFFDFILLILQILNMILRGMPFKGTSAHERRKELADTDSKFKDSTVLCTQHSNVVKGWKSFENLCPTSIHTLVSANLKLLRTTKLPPERKVFRGLGRMHLGSKWFSPNQRGARSGVELGFMSTTLKRNVALEYSGVKIGGVGTILEFDVGEIDCGAQLDFLSQYPGFKRSSCFKINFPH